MLGTFGFFIGAIAIALFAVTAWKAYRTVEPVKLRLFVTAFLLFALAMAIWGLSVAQPDAYSIRPFLFAGDTLLVLATACMAFVLLGGMRIMTGVIAGLLAALLLANRMSSYPPTGYVENGLLHFNLTGGVRTVFLLAFVLIWLPAMLSVAAGLSRDRVFAGLSNVLTSCFILLVLVSALFVSARRPSMIIGQFTLIAVLFLAMTAVNILLIKLHNELVVAKGAKHVRRHAAAKSRSK